MKDINTRYLRSIVGCVSQEPVLFDFSILENIKFGNHSASMEEIERAAKDANVHDFIKGLPDGKRRGRERGGREKERGERGEREEKERGGGRRELSEGEMRGESYLRENIAISYNDHNPSHHNPSPSRIRYTSWRERHSIEWRTEATCGHSQSSSEGPQDTAAG